MIPNESFWSLIAFDPRQADAIEQVEEAVTKWGMKSSKEEIDLMLDNGLKLEVEALISKDISYVTEEYVPARLAEAKFLD